MTEASPKIVGILQVIGVLNAVLSDEELNALIDAVFTELGIPRPTASSALQIVE